MFISILRFKSCGEQDITRKGKVKKNYKSKQLSTCVHIYYNIVGVRNTMYTQKDQRNLQKRGLTLISHTNDKNAIK